MRFPAEPSTSRLPYPDLLRQVRNYLGLGHLQVEGPPPSTSPWVIPLDEPQGTPGAALVLDYYMLSELLDDFTVP